MKKAHGKTLTKMREGFETNLSELRARCDERLASLEDDLELRRKVYIPANHWICKVGGRNAIVALAPTEQSCVPTHKLFHFLHNAFVFVKNETTL